MPPPKLKPVDAPNCGVLLAPNSDAELDAPKDGVEEAPNKLLPLL
jgi:hypothetical protein